MGLVCDINTLLACASGSPQIEGKESKFVNDQSRAGPSETGVRGTSFLERLSLRTSATATNANYQVWVGIHPSLARYTLSNN
jgi:hypothetical protein